MIASENEGEETRFVAAHTATAAIAAGSTLRASLRSAGRRVGVPEGRLQTQAVYAARVSAAKRNGQGQGR